MRAIVFDKPHAVAVREVPRPKVGPGEVLVQVEVCGICGTDVHLYDGDFVPRYPLIPGHEFAGVAVEVGDGVTGIQVGERVAVDPSVYCESCEYCRRNKPNHCLNWNALGVTLPGGFAEFVAVPERCVFNIAELPFAHGAFIEPLACVVYGQERARLGIGDSVLIFGAGPIGLLHLQLAKRAGAASVAVVDVRAERLQLARTLGAAHTVLSRPNEAAALTEVLQGIAPRGFDLVIDATGVPRVVESALGYVGNGGKLLIFGVCPNESEIRLNPYEIYKRDLEIIGAFALRKTFAQALDLLTARAIEVDALIGKTVNLSEFPEALALMRAGQAPMKIQVDPQNRQPLAGDLGEGLADRSVG